MYRSFTDRVFGGVCGGLGALFPIGAWWFRILFIILTLLTTGAFAALYVLLWWAVPQQSLAGRQRGGAGLLLLAILLTVAMGVGYVLHLTGNLRGPSGADLFWPAVLLALCVVFFIKQVRP